MPSREEFTRGIFNRGPPQAFVESHRNPRSNEIEVYDRSINDLRKASDSQIQSLLELAVRSDQAYYQTKKKLWWLPIIRCWFAYCAAMKVHGEFNRKVFMQEKGFYAMSFDPAKNPGLMKWIAYDIGRMNRTRCDDANNSKFGKDGNQEYRCIIEPFDQYISAGLDDIAVVVKGLVKHGDTSAYRKDILLAMSDDLQVCADIDNDGYMRVFHPLRKELIAGQMIPQEFTTSDVVDFTLSTRGKWMAVTLRNGDIYTFDNDKLVWHRQPNEKDNLGILRCMQIDDEGQMSVITVKDGVANIVPINGEPVKFFLDKQKITIQSEDKNA